MALAVERPARRDLSFRTNDDALIGWQWLHPDKTPIVITSATFTLEFDLPPTQYDEDGVPLPAPDPERHIVDSTTPGEPAGWIDAANLASGYVLVRVPHGIWALYSTTSTGLYDVIVIGEGIQGCLGRARFAVEQGVST